MIHIHRYTWGEKYEEQWQSLIGGSVYYHPPQYEYFTRIFQDGKCKCGKIKKRRV